MPSLKDLRIRINSVKSTRKITSAMKMVAASKLRRAQVAAEQARPYAERMERMASDLARSVRHQAGASKLLTGTGNDNVHLIVTVTSDRGLCAGFNSSIVREAKRRILALEKEGKTVKVICVGRKGRDGLKRDYPRHILDTVDMHVRSGVKFADADAMAHRIRDMFEAGEFDVCTVIYNRFKSVISQEVTALQFIPFQVKEDAAGAEVDGAPLKALYEYEPSEEDILAALLPRNLAVQMFRAMLESYASEQGARMSAMDNATRNAGDMINRLTLTYNRARQAAITKELIEIISGAEAL